MKKDNVIVEKSYAFALEIIELYKYMVYNLKEYEMSKQILRCGTSIGANTEEALGGQSRKDFIAKISIAYKESREANYWLRLLRDCKVIPENMIRVTLKSSEEIKRILAAILLASKKNVH